MAGGAGWLTPSARGALHLAVQVALAVALFVVLQVLATHHNIRFDLTPTQDFVLSQQATHVASAFTRPALITVFYNSQESGRNREIRDLLEQFRTAAPQLDFRLLDLDRSPGLARKYGISSYNTGVIETDEEQKILRGIDEGEITSALLRLSRDRTRTLCFVTGHGERSPRDTDERAGYNEVAKALERERFRISAISTIPGDGVPQECTVVVLAGPSHDLLPGEAEALTHYLRGGGRVLLLADPDAPPSIVTFLREVGIEPGHDLIVDEQNRFLGADSFMPQVLRFRSELFGNNLDAPAVLSLARTIRPKEQAPSGIRVIHIAQTSPSSWARAGAGHVPDTVIRFRRNVDEPGPLSVGVMATFEDGVTGGADSTPTVPGQLIVFGDSDFATNFYLNLLGNRDLFMSTIALLAEDPELIAVRRKGLLRGTLSPVTLTAWQARVIFWVAVVVPAAVCLVLGTMVTLVRRRQRGGR